MNYSMIRYILASVLEFEGAFLLLPAVVGGVYGEKQGITYLIVAVCCLALGFLGRIKKPKRDVFYSKEGFVAVSLSWLLLSFIGAIPFVLTGEIPSYINALFETISGFTTTGSTILKDVEELSHCTLFWRSFTHWIGGMGVLVFIMAILPLSGSSSLHMMKAESPGPSVGKLVPKLKHTAMILYSIYIGITLLEMIILVFTGVTVFEAMTLTFGTVGTGGFGVLNDSIASYGMATQVVILIFMLICSINFGVYYLLLLRRPKEALKNEEMRYFLFMVVASTTVIAINIYHTIGTVSGAIHHSLFQVLSVTSTTGYTTADFNAWPGLSKMILVLLMFVGACAGSTGGGFKMSRVIIIVKAVKNEIQSITHPKSVRRVRIEGKQLSSDMVQKVLCYLGAYILIIATSIFVVGIEGRDFTTTVTSVVATFNNIGPGLNDVFSSFADLSILSKIVLMIDMLVGRLEIFPMLVLFTPGLWKTIFKKTEK